MTLHGRQLPLPREIEVIKIALTLIALLTLELKGAPWTRGGDHCYKSAVGLVP